MKSHFQSFTFRQKGHKYAYPILRKSAMMVVLALFTFAANAQDDIFETVRQGTAENLRSIIEANPALADSRDNGGYTPLILAAYHGNPEMVMMLAPLADVNYISSYGTALMAAAVKGHADIAKALLDHKADPNIGDADGNTPLLFASMFQNHSLALLLLEHGADPNAKNDKGFSALDYAKMHQNTELIIRFENH